MKKLAVILAVVFLSVAAFGQQKQTTTTTTKTKADTTKMDHKKGTMTDKKWDKDKTTKSTTKDMSKAKKDTTKMKK